MLLQLLKLKYGKHSFPTNRIFKKLLVGSVMFLYFYDNFFYKIIGMHLTQKVYINNLIIHECLASNDIRHNYVEQNIRIFLCRNMSVVKVASRL